MTDEQQQEETISKEEIYKIADEKKMLVCGDPQCMDEETGIDWSHVNYLLETEKVTESQAQALMEMWPTLWPVLQQLMDSLVQSTRHNEEVNQMNMDWRSAYAELSTENRIAQKFISRSMHLKKEYEPYRKKELKKLEKAMEKTLARHAEEKAKLEEGKKDEVSTTEA